MTGRLHFITLNARGLIEKQKRDQIMLWIKNQKADVIFLQETHYTKSIIPFIETEWSGSLFHSFGTSNSRGVSVLISNRAPVTVIDHQQTDDGRVVLVNIEVNDSMLTCTPPIRVETANSSLRNCLSGLPTINKD